jgi:hypothetical protein
MPEEKGQHEPSMEEILASIRRIIAADDAGEGDAAAPAAATAATATATPAAEDDVLELTEIFEEEEEGPVANEPDMPLAHDGTPLLKLDDELPPMEMPAAARSHDEVEEARLVSATSAAASVAALSQLVNRPRERNGELPLGNANRTLEDMVREILRPLLKDWLDEHLPQLVERLVHDEIERLVREAQGH